MKQYKIIFVSIIFTLLFFHLKGQEEQIVLRTESGEITGTLTLPENKTNIPLVIIIAGSGPTDRNGNQEGAENNSLKFISNELTKNEIASLRFDKRGVGHSTDAIGEEINLSFDDYVVDVKQWIDLIAKDKRFSKIIIAGHSEGALIGMIAAVNNSKVNAYISIAGAGRPADEIIKEQLSTTPQSVKDVVYPMLDGIKKGDTITNVPPIFYSLFRPSIQPYMTSWFKYNPQEEIKKLNIPILILQGSTDIQVKETDAELLLKSQPNAKIEIIKNMNHVLKDCDTLDKEIQTPIYSNPELPLNKNFVLKLMEFIKGVK